MPDVNTASQPAPPTSSPEDYTNSILAKLKVVSDADLGASIKQYLASRVKLNTLGIYI